MNQEISFSVRVGDMGHKFIAVFPAPSSCQEKELIIVLYYAQSFTISN